VAAKIVALSHGALAVILVWFATTIPQSRAFLVDAGIIACGVVAYGCWRRRRWVATLGAVPLGLAAITAAIMAGRLPGFFSSREGVAIDFVAFSVVILEIVAAAVANESGETSESSSE